MDKFIAQYIETMLWSTCDHRGMPLDRKHGPKHIAPETLSKIEQDCNKFQADNIADLEGLDPETVAHNFWLTRNGHGAGFWDGDFEKGLGERLTVASHIFGESYPYIGDDGMIYI